MGEAKTLMLLSGGHPVHRGFGESIGAESRLLMDRAAKGQFPPFKALNLLRGALSVPTGFDTVVCESCYYYPAIKRRLGLLGKTKIINMNCGPLLYHMITSRLGGMEKGVLMGLLREVDGHLVYGTYGMEQLSRLQVKRPARIIYPFINSRFMEKLASVEPALDSHNIVIVATSDPYNKGLDLLFQAMKEVRERYPDARLDIITRMPEQQIRAISDFDPSCMRILVNVPDIAAVFASSSLYLQPSRGDMFPVACLEAMAAGLPAIVSSENGAKETIQKIEPGMVVQPDAGSIAKAVIAYFAKTAKEKRGLSARCRSAASFFNEKDMLALFKKQFDLLSAEISPKAV